MIIDEIGPSSLTVVLDGILDLSTAHLLEVAVRACPDWVQEVVVDLSALREVGPGGAGALARGYIELFESGRRVVLRDPSPAVQALLDRWHLGDLVERRDADDLDVGMARLLAAIVALDEPPLIDLRDEKISRR